MSDYEFNSMPAGAIGRYSLLKDAYSGTGGFENGGYLEKHERESKEAFAKRCNSAYYLNYFAPIVNALVDPIFKRKPLRDFKGPAEDFIIEFSKDVDRAGTDIQTFMKQVALHAKIYGVAFIVMDCAPVDESTATRLDMIKNKAYPYAYCLDPEYVDSFGVDNKGSITYIRFHEISGIDNGAIKYRYVEFTRTGWRVTDEEKGTTSGTYNLGRVPVIPLYARLLEKKIILPSPELLSEAKVAKAIYNHCSWLTEILKNQSFPVLTLPSLTQKDIVVGTNNALGYDPASSHEPNYIAPPSDPAEVLRAQIQTLAQEMYRMASLSFMTSTGGDSTNKSGLARQWEFERTNQQLANFAGQCAKAENEMMQLFCKWIGSSIDYQVSYPDDFGVVDIADELAQAQAVLDLQLTNKIKEEVLKKVLAAYCPNITDERFDELLEDVKNDEDDKVYSEPKTDESKEAPDDKSKEGTETA